jgi:hypothetical protein
MNRQKFFDIFRKIPPINENSESESDLDEFRSPLETVQFSYDNMENPTVNNPVEEREQLLQEINRLRALVGPEQEDTDSINNGIISIENDSFAAIGKIPDIVREIPQFDGNPTKLTQWISDVDGVIELFTQFKGTHKYQLVLRTIRRKIVGEADHVLNSNNTPLSWKNIRESLILHYSDRRDLMTLNSQLNAMTRKNDSIETFFAKIQEIHSLITNCVRMENQYKGGEHYLIKLYSEICLDTFIRGIGQPLSQFLRNYKPQSLCQAYKYAIEFQNVEFRSKLHVPATVPTYQKNIQKPFAPRFAPAHMGYREQNQQRQWQQPMHQKQFTQPQNNAFAPRGNFSGRSRNQYSQQPEPMEIDRSIRSNLPRNQNQNNQNGVIRKAMDTPSWRANAPPGKRTAHLVQLEPQPEEINEQWQDDIQSYLTLAEEGTDKELPDNDYPEENQEANFCYLQDHEEPT